MLILIHRFARSTSSTCQVCLVTLIGNNKKWYACRPKPNASSTRTTRLNSGLIHPVYVPGLAYHFVGYLQKNFYIILIHMLIPIHRFARSTSLTCQIFLVIWGVGDGWAGWALAHPLFSLTFIEKGHLPTHFLLAVE